MQCSLSIDHSITPFITSAPHGSGRLPPFLCNMSTAKDIADKYSLKGYKCLVTGGTKGMGKAVVEEFAK